MDDVTLETRANSGDTAAQMELAGRLDARGQIDPSRGWFARAARSGSRDGLRELGISLLKRPPFRLADGLRFVHNAAQQGDAGALRICAALAAQDVQLAGRWELALDFLRRAAEAGSDAARRDLRLLSRETEAGTDWAGLARRVDIAAWRRETPFAVVSETPRICVIENFASAEFCDWLIGESEAILTRAKTYTRGAASPAEDARRTNREAGFDVTRWGLAVSFLRERIARLTQASPLSLENPMVLCYDPGESFAPHHDFLDPDVAHLRDEIATMGQRVATFLVWLNEDFEGAETEFVKLGLRFRGRKGDAIMWRNVDEAGRPDLRTLHAGRAPTAGRKWLLSQWVREDYPGAAGAARN
ncbi:MAG TPA: 2OG-Fe(II) oxygenase [Rhizomicrobium sp.]|nr:2OG-Fe(II) oxygenase [Rhizomicrobium sp.]